MVAGVGSVVAPQESISVHQYEHRKCPGVTMLAAYEVALDGRADTACERFGTEHLGDTPALHPEGLIESFVGIADTCSFWPELLEEGHALCGTPHENEDHSWKVWIAPGDPAEVLHDLLREQSAEVTQKHEQGRTAGQDVGEPPVRNTDTIDWMLQNAREDRLVYHLLCTTPTPRPDEAFLTGPRIPQAESNHRHVHCGVDLIGFGSDLVNPGRCPPARSSIVWHGGVSQPGKGAVQYEENGLSAREHLPSALDVTVTVDELLAGRLPAVFLDYDGVLTPIVAHPDLALLAPETREVISRLSAVHTVAVVSGRDTDDVREKVGVPGVYYAGSHGFDIVGPSGERVSDGELGRFENYLAPLTEAAAQVEDAIAEVHGAHVERKRFAIAVHFRQAAEADEAAVEAAVRMIGKAQPLLRITGGKKILEFRPDLDWDKGRALLWLLDAMQLDPSKVAPVYLGDDTTDEDAFAVIRSNGVGIVVGSDGPPTRARLLLEDPVEVRRFLERLTASEGTMNE
jgi:trehalose-phosphatase